MSKVVVDSMLGKLARYLRILGVDTLYSPEYDDKRMIEECAKGERVLITRDKVLHAKAVRLGCKSVLIESESNVARMLALLAGLGLVELELRPERSRCPICNGTLVRSGRRGLAEGIAETYICSSCSNTYWIGSHWRTIRRTLEEAREWLRRSS